MDHLPNLSDEELFGRVRQGDPSSLALLVHRYEGDLYAFLVQMTGDAHLAEDLFQETFLHALRASGTFDPNKSFRPWIHAVAVNLVRDQARKRKLRGEVALGDQPPEENEWADRQKGPARLAEENDEARRIAQALAALTLKEREVILLHFYQWMTLEDVGAALQIPVGTVKSRLHVALKKLKDILEP